MPEQLPVLRTPAHCRALGAALPPGPVVALWASVNGPSTVDILLFFRNMLRERGRQVIFLLRRSGLEHFLALCPPQEREPARQLDDPALLAHCPFITLLFTSDLCLGERPAGFGGKVVLLPHNFETPVPSGERYWADYAVSPVAGAAPFDFSRYPNTIKIHRNSTYTVIPAGYPRFDLLARDRARQGAGPHKRISFFPYWALPSGVSPKSLVLSWRMLIEHVLEALPDWQFVLRPYAGSRNLPAFQSLREHFAAEPRFICDLGAENARYLASADFLLTDQSSVWRNFVYAALRPAILLRPGAKELQAGPALIRKELYYLAGTKEAVVAAVKDALARAETWENVIRRQRDRDVLHFGASCAYLCDHLENILNDDPAPDWTVLDKGDTPYERPADWLRLLAKPFSAWKPNDPPQIMAWSRELVGEEPRVALAFLRSSLLSWNAYGRFQAWESLRLQMENALAIAPAWTRALLRRLRKRNPEHGPTLVWLAEALARWEPQSTELAETLEQIRFLRLDPVLAARGARLLRLFCKASRAALELLEKAVARNNDPLPQWIFTLLFLLRLECGRIADAEELRESWRQSHPGYKNSIEDLLCRDLLEETRNGRPPLFFQASDHRGLALYDISVAFSDAQQAHACLKGALALLRKKAGADSELWPQCALLHAMSGQYATARFTAMRSAKPDAQARLMLAKTAKIMQHDGEAEKAGDIMRLLGAAREAGGAAERKP